MAPEAERGARYAALVELLEQRHSCRAFLPETVPRETQQAMFEAAQRSPSWCNSQPWQVVVVEGPAIVRLRDALRAHVEAGGAENPDFPFPKEYAGVYQQRRRACGLQLYASVGLGRNDRDGARAQSLRNFDFFDAPHVAIVTSPDALGEYGAVDCGGYLAHLMLAATALGVSAIAQAAIARYSAFVRAELDIASDRRVVFAVSFGYADVTHPANSFRTDRASVEESVRWSDR